MNTCDVCNFTTFKPLPKGQMGTCYRCPGRTRHIPATDGPLPGHALCDGSAVYDGQGRTTAPVCPLCVHAQQTGIDPIRERDMVLLGYVIKATTPLWEAGGHETLSWETERGRRLVRDGYLIDHGDRYEPTPAGRALYDAYDAARKGSAKSRGALALAMALRAMDTPVIRQYIGTGCGVRSCSQVRTVAVMAPEAATVDQLRAAAAEAIRRGDAQWLEIETEHYGDATEWTMHADGGPRCGEHTDTPAV